MTLGRKVVATFFFSYLGLGPCVTSWVQNFTLDHYDDSLLQFIIIIIENSIARTKPKYNHLGRTNANPRGNQDSLILDPNLIDPPFAKLISTLDYGSSRSRRGFLHTLIILGSCAGLGRD